MSDRQDQQLEEMLREHLHEALDGQLGRATAAFASEAAPARSMRFGQMRWMLTTVSGVAAGLLIAWGLSAVLPSAQAPLPQVTQGADVVELPPGLLPARDVERFVAWRAIPEGAAMMGEQRPLQRVRRQMLQQVEWFDPQDNAHITLRKPKEDIVFVEMNQN